MIEHIDIQSVIDIGFVILVTFTCAKTLIADQSSTAQSKNDSWKEELKAVEKSLQDLIAEAGAASRNLDRNLLQRKQELEIVLKKLEGHSRTDTVNSSAKNIREQRYREDSSSDELPNETWLARDIRTGSESSQAGKDVIGKKKRNTNDYSAKVTQGEDHFTLESIVDVATDQISLSSSQRPQEEQQIKTNNSSTNSTVSTLAESIEVSQFNAQESETYNLLSIMDPTTFRIARRLLKEGKEIHVVARKLDLPVSEIRMLDRLMHREEGLAGDEALIPKQIIRTPNNEKISQNWNTKRRAPAPTQETEDIVERSIALL